MSTSKERYGWSLDVERFLIEHDQKIPKGTFTIQTRSGKRYWYYNLSSGYPRLIYLCSVEDKGAENSSFRNAVNALMLKLKHPTERITSRPLIKIIDRYIDELRREGYSNVYGVERTKKTTQDIIYHMNAFREYSLRNKLNVVDCTKIEFGEHIIMYVAEMKVKYKLNTIKRHLTSIKMFLNDLVQPKSGKPIISSHPISPLFLKRNFNFRKELSSTDDNFYSEDVYNLLFNLCATRVREIWINYQSKGIRTIDSSNLVYFITLLQLNYGFRIGEIIDAYKSKSIYTDKYVGKGGFSYIERDIDDISYTFTISTKNKLGMVYVDYGIFSWNKPFDKTPHRRLTEDEFKTMPYEYNIIEVMLVLFSNKTHLVSLDRSSYFKLFKEIIVEKEAYGTHGVKTTHDLRDMCINYLMHTKGYSPTEIAQLTRHSIHTMEMYYLHRNKALSKQSSQLFNTKKRLGDVKKNLPKMD